MNETIFDTWTRSLATSRRNALKTLLGGALGVLPIWRIANEAAAGCKKVGKKCDKSKDCCDGAKCKKDKCKCKGGRSECGGKCFDPDNDESHCGDCDTACSASETCCSGTCVELSSDRDNCAVCGAACGSDEICLDGACIPCPIGNLICGDVCCPTFRTCCDGGVCADFCVPN